MITEKQLKSPRYFYPYLIGIIVGITVTIAFIEFTNFYVRQKEYNDVVNELSVTKHQLLNVENSLLTIQDSLANTIKINQQTQQGRNSKSISVNGNNNKLAQ